MHRYASDPEVVKYMPWGPNSEEDTHDFLQKRLTEQAASPRVNYSVAITLKEDGTLIGGCDLTRRNSEVSEAALGYCLHKDYWGRGIASEAAGALLKCGFEELKLHRIIATCDPENLASRRVLEKNGLRLEGHFKENILMRGIWRDSLSYAILDNEWNKRQYTDS